MHYAVHAADARKACAVKCGEMVFAMLLGGNVLCLLFVSPMPISGNAHVAQFEQFWCLSLCE